MSRLAVKLFAWIWLAFILLLAGLSLVVDRWNPSSGPQPLSAPQLRQWQQIEERVTGVFQRRGLEGVANFARDVRENRGMDLYLLDASGTDLLGQEVPTEIRQYALSHRGHGPMMQLEAQRLLLGPGPLNANAPQGSLVLWLPITDVTMAPVSSLWSGPQATRRLAVALVASGIVAFLLSISLTRPIRGLQSAVSQLGQGNYDIAGLDQAARRRDEIGDLAREFQTMVSSLKSSTDARQRLMRDISHELRSPLARLRAAIELAELQAGHGDKPDLDRMTLECRRLDEMIGSVLALARAEHEDPNDHRQAFDLADLVSELVEDARFEGSAEDKGVDLNSVEHAPYMGYPALIASAIENVLRNALRHTRSGTSVVVDLRTSDRGVEISISDCGPGVPVQELEKIFEPFYRVQNGRDQPVGGTGVGLAITFRAVQRHGGAILARNRSQGGLEILISLPMTTSTT